MLHLSSIKKKLVMISNTIYFPMTAIYADYRPAIAPAYLGGPKSRHITVHRLALGCIEVRYFFSIPSIGHPQNLRPPQDQISGLMMCCIRLFSSNLPAVPHLLRVTKDSIPDDTLPYDPFVGDQHSATFATCHVTSSAHGLPLKRNPIHVLGAA